MDASPPKPYLMALNAIRQAQFNAASLFDTLDRKEISVVFVFRVDTRHSRN
jgi:hypothetical protein